MYSVHGPAQQINEKEQRLTVTNERGPDVRWHSQPTGRFPAKPYCICHAEQPAAILDFGKISKRLREIIIDLKLVCTRRFRQ